MNYPQRRNPNYYHSQPDRDRLLHPRLLHQENRRHHHRRPSCIYARPPSGRLQRKSLLPEANLHPARSTGLFRNSEDKEVHYHGGQKARRRDNRKNKNSECIKTIDIPFVFEKGVSDSFSVNSLFADLSQNAKRSGLAETPLKPSSLIAIKAENSQCQIKN